VRPKGGEEWQEDEESTRAWTGARPPRRNRPSTTATFQLSSGGGIQGAQESTKRFDSLHGVFKNRRKGSTLCTLCKQYDHNIDYFDTDYFGYLVLKNRR